MNEDTLEIEVIPELTAFAQGMQQLPVIGDRESKKMAGAIGKNMRSVEKDSTDAAKSIGSNFQSNFGKISGSAAAMSGVVGGTFAQVVGVANSAIRPLGEMAAAFGPIGVAVAGLAGGAVAMGGLLAATKGVVDAAVEARDRLTEAGLASQIPAESIRSLRDYETTTSELREELDLLTVTVGGALADDLAILVHTTAELVRWTREAGETTSDWGGFLLDVAASLHPAIGATIELGRAAYTVADAQTEAAISSREWADAETDALIALGMLDEELKTTTKTLAAKSIAEGEAAEESRRIREEMLAANELFQSAEIEGSQRVRDELVANNEAVLASRKAYHDKYLAMLQAEGAALEEQAQREREVAQIRRETWAKLADDTIASTRMITDAVVRGYTTRLNSGEKMGRKERNQMEESASRAYGLGQALAATQVILSAAITGAGVTANLALAMGPFAAVAGGAAAAGVLATGLTAIALAPAPEFPMGGMVGNTPDHHTIRARADEGVATSRGVRALGGSQGLDDLNLGRLPGDEHGAAMVGLLERIARGIERMPRGSESGGLIRAARGRRTVYGGGY